MYGCKSWTIMMAECWRIDAFEEASLREGLLEKTLESPSDSKEIKPVYPKGLMLKLQYFGHLMQKSDSLEKDSDARKD